jgi:hypothetical protein
MKKIILFLLLFFSLSAFSQNPIYTRAYEMYIGTSDSDKKSWKENPIKVNLLIQVDQNKITIHSDVVQVYHTIKLLYENEQGTTKWSCSDLNGKSCYLTIGSLNSKGSTFFQVEYNDYTWVYFCKSE